MSSSNICARGKHNSTAFILSCAKTVFGEIRLHGRWLPAEQLRLYMHMKCNIGDDIAFTLSSMMRVINKVLPSVNSEPITMEIAGSLPLQICRYTYQHRTRRYFFWVTTKVRETPTVPSQRYESAWEQDSVLTRLLSRSNRNMNLLQDEREPKRHKGLQTGEAVTADSEYKTIASAATSTAEGVGIIVRCCGGWWDSGDARKLFAPCKLLYETNCDVKAIVLERIEVLESVSCSAMNWKNVIDARCTPSSKTKSHYSESDVLSLRYRSMYLALALKQFVLNVTNNLKTQWTWRRCLNWAIEAMNDVGVEYYSSCVTLQKWHRKIARHRFYFYKAPQAKKRVPDSLSTILMQWTPLKSMPLQTLRTSALK